MPSEIAETSPGLQELETSLSEAAGVATFLEELYRLIENETATAAGLFICRSLYHIRINKQFVSLDRILNEVDVTRLAPVLSVSILTVTAPARKHLSHRAAFFVKARDTILALRGPELTERILVGLE